MKGPEYAWTVVKAYKNKLEKKEESHHLNQIFNRGYTQGLLMGDPNWVDDKAPGNRGELIGTVLSYNHKLKRLKLELNKKLHKGDEIQIRRNQSSVGTRVDMFYLNDKKVLDIGPHKIIDVDFKHVVKKGEKIFRTYDAKWMTSVHEKVRETLQFPLEMTMEIKINKPLKLTLKDSKNNFVEIVSEAVGEKPLKSSLDKERVYQQLKKLGQTPYFSSSCHIDLDENVTVAIKEINNLRRRGVDLLNEKRSHWHFRKDQALVEKKFPTKKHVMPNLSVSVKRKDQREALVGLGVEIIYSEFGKDIPLLPNISSQTLDASIVSENDEVLVSNIGQVGLYKDHSWIGNSSLNVFNSHGLDFYKRMNCKRMTLSQELSKKEILEIKTDLPLELLVYGHVPLMVTKYCPFIKKTMDCDNCQQFCLESNFLIDRFNEKFPLVKEKNAMGIYSHKPIHLMPFLKSFLPGPIEVFRLSFTVESKETVRRITKAYLEFIERLEETHLDIDSHNHHFTKGVE
jgi:putative protease